MIAFIALSLFAAEPFAADNAQLLGKFRNTHYYVVIEADYLDPIDTVIRDMRGRVLAEVSTRFRKDMDIEGTGKLRDGRVVNYAGRVNGEIRYLVTPHEWGLGVGNCPLIPFRSVAVDPERIPLGSVVQIDETIGMVLPDGTLHDGIWLAEDIGGAIKKDRVDLFIGLKKHSGHLLRHNIRHLTPLTVRMIRAPLPGSCVERIVSLDEDEFDEFDAPYGD